LPFVFTGFQPLSTINGKNVASAFGKSEHQSWWTRRADDETWEAQRHWKKTVMLGGDDCALLSSSTLPPANTESSSANDQSTIINGDSSTKPNKSHPSSSYHSSLSDPAQRTIVIHPGSRTVQIGRACDPLPISIPNVVARRRYPNHGKQPLSGLFRNFEPSSTQEAKDTFTSKTNAIRTELRSRMRAIKLRGITNGQSIAANHNTDAAPLTLSEDQDPLGTVWPPVSGPESKDLYVGDDALLIPEPEKNNYAVRWPIVRGQLNSSEDSGYLTKGEILADIEAVWVYALSTRLGIKEQDLKVNQSLAPRLVIVVDILTHLIHRNIQQFLFYLISMITCTCGKWSTYYSGR
jgi:actin-related protein 8